MENALIVVAKKPAPGTTKTRLVPPLSPQRAAELYRCLLLDTLHLMRRVGNVQPVIAYTPADAESYFRAIAPPGFDLVAQQGQTLGERLDRVLRAHLQMGYRRVVVMDSDSPTLPAEYLLRSFHHLDADHVDVVVGPCEDGGYYLIGLKHPCSALFKVVMSTSTVFHETLRLAHREGLRTICLPVWYDTDTPQDLERLQRELAGLPADSASCTRQLLSGWRQSPTWEGGA
jgi:rSAM/selenodomain-associated transferase 1